MQIETGDAAGLSSGACERIYSDCNRCSLSCLISPSEPNSQLGERGSRDNEKREIEQISQLAIAFYSLLEKKYSKLLGHQIQDVRKALPQVE